MVPVPSLVRRQIVSPDFFSWPAFRAISSMHLDHRPMHKFNQLRYRNGPASALLA